MEGYSLFWLKREQNELQRDRHAFASALDLLRKRILESNDVAIPRHPLLHEWSGTRAAVGSLEMALHSVERTLEEINSIILAIDNNEVLNTDLPLAGPISGVN